MSRTFEVAIPSKGRAGKVTTHKLFTSCTLYVPASEAAEYRKYHEAVVPVPDKVKGITATRNFMLDHVTAERHVQVDDDATNFWLFEQNARSKITDPKRIEALIEQMFVITEEWGAKIFGLNLANDMRFYREYSPFSTLSVIGANILGIIDNPLRFDERLRVKEDYDYSLRHIYKYRRAIRFNKYCIQVTHLVNEGGCASYRTEEVEMDALKTMQKKFGTKVVKRASNQNYTRVRVPFKGI